MKHPSGGVSLRSCLVNEAESSLSQGRVEEIRTWMSSPEAFKNALNDEQRYRQYLLDQYQ
jgi:hypothetical protein